MQICTRRHKSLTHKKAQEFNVGDYVMVQIHPEWYPPSTIKKLHARSSGPFKNLRKINFNAYAVDLSSDFGISPSFNIEDLKAYMYFFSKK